MQVCTDLVFVIFVLTASTTLAVSLDSNDIAIVILSQKNQYQLKLAETLKNSILKQAETQGLNSPVVHLSHIDFPHSGGWTVLPLIPKLEQLHAQNSSWIFFVEDRTHVELTKLMETLAKYNQTGETFIGYALHDAEASIIHHFAFYENPEHFKYPNIASGFAISSKLMQRLSKRLKKRAPLNSDFSIDNAHELSLFIWDKGKGIGLKHEPAFCATDELHCASYPKPFQPCGELAPIESIYFAVKTCEKFHKDRVPVVKRTWAQHARNINFFSDVEDASIPTISLGIPNTENGHCGKTMAIIRFLGEALEKLPQVKWIVLADDDTILSVGRLREVLTCYDPEEPIVLGERYGYNVHDAKGYNYVTGGGGIVFSRPLVEMLSTPGTCDCPSASTPDDMFLGICIAELGIEITHSPLFHQARPVDYASEYLKSQNSVSFHKHWMIDPVYVYEKWLSEVSVSRTKLKHNEL